MNAQSTLSALTSPSGSRSSPAGSRSRGNAAGQFKRDIIPEGYQVGQLQQYTPQQMKLHAQQFQHVSPDSYLSRLASGDQSFYEEMEAPAWRQFQEAQGQLGSRFSQLAPGAMSAQRGGGFKNAANQQSIDFSQGLASRRQELQRQAIMDLMGLSNQLLNQRPYERDLFEKPPEEESAWNQWAPVIGAGVGAAGGFFAGGPAGAYSGAKLGLAAGSAFGGR